MLSNLWQLKSSLENIDLFLEGHAIVKVKDSLHSFWTILKKIHIHKYFVNSSKECLLFSSLYKE